MNRINSCVLLLTLVLVPQSRLAAQTLAIQQFLDEAVPQWNQVRQTIDLETRCIAKLRDWSPKNQIPDRFDEEVRSSKERFLHVYDNRNEGNFFLIRDLQTIVGQRKVQGSPWTLSEIDEFNSMADLEKKHLSKMKYSRSIQLHTISADFGVLLEDFFKRTDFNWEPITREGNLVTVKCSWVEADKKPAKAPGLSYSRFLFVFDASKNYQWISRTGTWGNPTFLTERYEVERWAPFEGVSLPQTLVTSRALDFHGKAYDTKGNLINMPNEIQEFRCTLDLERSTEPNREEDFSLSRFGIPEVGPRKAGFKSIYLVALMVVVGAALVVWRLRGSLVMSKAS